VIRFQTPPHEVYTSLFRLVEQKEHFVITSNVDGMFVKGGFAEKRVFTPQGDYARYQCLTPCTTETWPVAPIIERILPTIDPATQEITDLTAIPRCPRCGGPVFANVRGGPWFVEEPYLEQEQRFTDWVTASSEKRLVILEIGAGFNTPGVIRWPLEQITHTFDETHLIRVNLDYPEVPRVLAAKATSLCMRGRDVIHAFTALRQTATGA
jgi:NAD-dependent SIR2 family protein deacetylase